MAGSQITMDDAVERVRERLDEDTEQFHKTTRLVRWINEGMRDLARRTQTWTVESAAIPVLANVQRIDLSVSLPDILQVTRLEWSATGQDRSRVLEYNDFGNLDAIWWESQTITAGDPYCYTTVGYPPNLTIVLYPTPAQNGEIKIQYYQMPAPVAAGANELSIPEGFDDLVLDYAEFRARRTDRDPEWMTAFQMYEANVERMMERTNRWVNAAGYIGHTPGPLPAWLYEG